MCDPLSIAGGVMAVGSMGANMMGANAQTRARNRVSTAERARQGAWESESANLFNNTLAQNNATATQQRTADAATRRTDEGARAISTPDPAQPAAASAPTVVNDSYSRAMSAALRRGLDRARAQAQVGAYGDAGVDTGVNLVRSGQEQARIGGNITRSAQIFPMELEAANQAGSGWRSVGSLLGVGGQIAGAAGAAGVGPSWGSIFGRGGWGNYTHTPVIGASGRIVGGL